MLLMLDPLVKAIEAAESDYGVAYKILLTPQGTTWDQTQAVNTVTKHEHVLIISGHYEGFDERLLEFVDAEVSIGRFVLSGGEAAALVIIDSLVRLIPGVLKKDEATRDETFMEVDKQELFKITQDAKVLEQPGEKVSLIEYPQYTRPEEFRGKRVPDILLSGNHQKIKEWQLRQAWEKTKRKSKDN